MRRVVGLLVVAALGVGAAAMIEPSPPEPPDFSGAVAPEPEARARSSVWYCAWADSGDLRDSDYVLASVPRVPSMTRTLKSTRRMVSRSGKKRPRALRKALSRALTGP